MSVGKMICWNCNTELVQYYNIHYEGRRAKCTICQVDFPLD